MLWYTLPIGYPFSVRVGIVQSNYIPWRGYFDLIGNCDVFVFLDDVQYTVRDWRNRNYIQLGSSRKLLTIPVGSSRHRRINEVCLPNGYWRHEHFNLIKANYKSYPFWNDYQEFLEQYYFESTESNLSTFNQDFITKVSRDFLNLKTIFLDSSSWNIKSRKQERILEILVRTDATHYITGPKAKSYLDESIFLKLGIKLMYIDYKFLTSYPQPSSLFLDNLSIIDLLMNCGSESRNYLTSKLRTVGLWMI